MSGTRYAETDARVYERDEMDAEVGPLQRALHDELCHNLPPNGLHGPNAFMPMCERAALVVRTVAALAAVPLGPEPTTEWPPKVHKFTYPAIDGPEPTIEGGKT